MRAIAILDVETDGLDPLKSQAIEVGVVLWSVEHRTVLEAYSALLPGDSNPCEAINRIPAAALPAPTLDNSMVVWETVLALVKRADACTAWNAAFDRGFLDGRIEDSGVPWFCAMDDLDWTATGYPAEGAKGLVAVALWHHVGVSDAHRALGDCLLLARLLEAVDRSKHPASVWTLEEWLSKGLARGTAPRARFISLAPFEQKDLVKAHGFGWNLPGFEKQWSRVMPIAEAAALPFKVRQVSL